eukprot:1947090-Amphidinium_carterae.1
MPPKPKNKSALLVQGPLPFACIMVEDAHDSRTTFVWQNQTASSATLVDLQVHGRGGDPAQNRTIAKRYFDEEPFKVSSFAQSYNACT